jgi:hypothetical protein
MTGFNEEAQAKDRESKSKEQDQEQEKSVWDAYRTRVPLVRSQVVAI